MTIIQPDLPIMAEPKPFKPGSKPWHIIRLFIANDWWVSGDVINQHVALARKWTNRVSDIRDRVGDKDSIICEESSDTNAAGERITKTVYYVRPEFRESMARLAPEM